ncbi:MAG: hypothetical protein KBA66_02320 [Leptospiraceae bacterium]|nr:hypothetical protein [Leptospiraceae bacterium]
MPRNLSEALNEKGNCPKCSKEFLVNGRYIICNLLNPEDEIRVCTICYSILEYDSPCLDMYLKKEIIGKLRN